MAPSRAFGSIPSAVQDVYRALTVICLDGIPGFANSPVSILRGDETEYGNACFFLHGVEKTTSVVIAEKAGAFVAVGRVEGLLERNKRGSCSIQSEPPQLNWSTVVTPFTSGQRGLYLNTTGKSRRNPV